MTGVLITRPIEDAQPLATAVAALGFSPIIEPLLTVVFRDGPLPPLGAVQAVLFTSANGARALGRLRPQRRPPAFAVGDASARAAIAAGFSDTVSAGGTVDDLAALVGARLDPTGGPLLHIAGTVTAGDLAGRLERQGFEVIRLPLYDARTADAVSPATATALRAGRIGAVLLFSPRTAQTFANLLAHGGLTAQAADVTAVCLSPAVAEAVAALPWARVAIAPLPTQDALLATLAALAPPPTDAQSP